MKLNKIKKFTAIALISSALCSSAFAGFSSKEKLDHSKVVAEFGDQKILMKEIISEFENAMKNSGNSKKFEELDKNIQDGIIKSFTQSKMLIKEAENSSIQNSKEFKEKIEKIRSQLAQQMFIESKIKSSLTETKIKNEYNNLKKEFTGQKKVKTSHILVEDEKLANEIKSKLNKGGDFASLAKEHSNDPDSKVKGGDLGYVTKGMLVPEYENFAFSAKKGEISTPIKTQFGYHIIKIEDIQDLKMPSYEEAKPSIENKLSKDAFENYVKELEKKLGLKYNF
jgi:peptidyl-prolyl cis-trans isomerase C